MHSQIAELRLLIERNHSEMMLKLALTRIGKRTENCAVSGKQGSRPCLELLTADSHLLMLSI